MGFWLDSKPVIDAASDFFAINSSLRFALRFCVEGLLLFLGRVSLPFLVSREKVKVEPMVREKVKAWPWLASVWQRSRHLEAKEGLLSPTEVIFNSNLN